jgi:signal transduction histidine kinase
VGKAYSVASPTSVSRSNSVRPQRKSFLVVEDLREVVGEAAEFMRRELEQQGVLLELQNASVPVRATVDEAQIKQVLYNLMRNAREAMPSHRSAA